MLPRTLLLCLGLSLFNPHSCYFCSLWSFPYFPPQDLLKNPVLPICLDTHQLFFAISFPSDSLKKMKTCLPWGVEMGKDCATVLTGFEELQKEEIEKRFGMQRLLPAIRSRDQLIIICTHTIFIIITIISGIIGILIIIIQGIVLTSTLILKYINKCFLVVSY